jgi:hypothetical protein
MNPTCRSILLSTAVGASLLLAILQHHAGSNASVPGAGWPAAEGIADTEGFTDPVQQWEPARASPSGLAHIDGTLFIANLRGEVLRAVPVADPSTSSMYCDGEFGPHPGRCRSPGREALVRYQQHRWPGGSRPGGRPHPADRPARGLSGVASRYALSRQSHQALTIRSMSGAAASTSSAEPSFITRRCSRGT